MKEKLLKMPIERILFELLFVQVHYQLEYVEFRERENNSIGVLIRSIYQLD